MKHARAYLAALVCAATMAALLAPSPARGVDLHVSGSAQLDYHFAIAPANARPITSLIPGFTEEASVKLSADLSGHLSANVKVCWGCHGFELPMAYVDYRVADELNIRAGRFNPTFGEFYLRHDVGNHRTSDRPLPYDMGRMLYLVEFNRSVLPLPYVENGVEVSGSHFFGGVVQLDYAAHAVVGLRAPIADAVDVDFASSRTPFYIDNNLRPSVGGRLGATFRLAPRVDLTVGGSILHGTYDPDSRLAYTVVGADLFLRVARTNLRAEYLIRRTDMAVGRPDRWEMEIPLGANGAVPDTIFMAKDGWYVELEQPINRTLDLVLRWDGLHRVGNVLTGSALDFDAGMSRWTLGAHVTIERGYRLKASLQHYTIWGVRNAPDQALGAHVSLVAVF